MTGFMTASAALLATIALSLAESVALLIALILLAVGFSVFVYRHTVPEISRRMRIVLIVLRSLALALVLFILFEPVLNLRHQEEIPPAVAVLVDDSRSMTVEDNGIARDSTVRNLLDQGLVTNLPSEAVVDGYRFGGSATPVEALEADSMTFTAGETNISLALQHAREAAEGRNLKAVVLVTDGNYTSGRNPVYTAEALGAPVFVVGVGDSTEKKDLLIGRVLANEVAYVESEVPVSVTVRSSGFESGTARVTLSDGSREIAAQDVSLRPGSNQYPVDFTFVPKSEGSKKLTVAVSPREGELTEKNNRQSIYIKVLKSKMKVALVAGAPSPDVSLFRRVMGRDKHMDVQLFVRKNASSWYGSPPTARTFADADCIVLLGYPQRETGSEALALIRDAVEKQNRPLLIMLSRSTDLGSLRAVLDPYLPFDIVQVRPNEAEVFFELTQEGQRSPITSSGIPADSWKKLPPLFKTESSFKARVGAEALGSMSINSISFTEPLLLSRKLNRRRVSVWTGYGLWRWELAEDVFGGKLPEMLIGNSIRWLTTREDRKPVRIRPVRELFDSGDDVEFVAEVYNDSYEPVDAAAVEVTIKGANGERELMLSPLGAGRYTGAIELSEEGDYSYSGSATAEGAELGKDAGRFSVGDLNLEFQETRMNTVLLRQIAQRSGGQYFDAEDAGGLASAVASAPNFVSEQRLIQRDIELWNLVWLLGLAVLLFGLEWYLRKQSGMI